MIEITKTYRTRCGYPVRFYATDGNDDYPIHGACCIEGKWYSSTWSLEGEAYLGSSSKFDLIEVKPRIQREVWCCVYEDHEEIGYAAVEIARNIKGSNCLAIVKLPIDCEHGEGLEDGN